MIDNSHTPHPNAVLPMLRQLYLMDPSGCHLAGYFAIDREEQGLPAHAETLATCLAKATQQGHKLCGAIASTLHRMTTEDRAAVIMAVAEPDPWEHSTLMARHHLDEILDGLVPDVEAEGGAEIEVCMEYRGRVVKVGCQLAPKPGRFLMEQLDAGTEGAEEMMMAFNLLTTTVRWMQDAPHAVECQTYDEPQPGPCTCGHEHIYRQALTLGAIQPLVHVKKLKAPDGSDLT